MTKFSKRISAFLFAFVFALSSAVCVFAESENKLIDDAGLFSAEDYSDIENRLEQVSEATDWDVIIYTNKNGVDSEDLKDYCNELYMDRLYGRGESNSGVMLTIDMASRGMNILTKGDAKEYFSDDRVDSIISDVRSYLSEDEFYSGAIAFINDVQEYASAGVPEDGTYKNIDDNKGIKFSAILIIFAISLALAGLSVVFVIFRYKHHGKSGTYDLKANSVTKILDRKDVFLYKNVSVTSESDDSDSSSGGSSDSSCGGGSSDF